MSNNNGERFFASWGVIVGISIGFFGNIFANYIYDSYKDYPIIHSVGLASFVIIVIFLFVMTFYMLLLGKRMSKK